MNYLSRNKKPLPLTKDGRAALKELKTFLQQPENIKQHYSRQTLAKKFSASNGYTITEYFLKIHFTKYFKLSLLKYQRKLRMQTAKKMLLSKENFPLKHITEVIDYETVPAFSSAFHEDVGQSPHDFRLSKGKKKRTD